MQCHQPSNHAIQKIQKMDRSKSLFEVWQRGERGEGCWCWSVDMWLDWTGWILRRGADPPIYGRIVVWSSVNLIATNPILSSALLRRDSDIPLHPGLLSSVERRNSNQISFQTNNEAPQPCPAQPYSRQEMLGMKINLNQRLCFPNWVVIVGTTTVGQ